MISHIIQIVSSIPLSKRSHWYGLAALTVLSSLVELVALSMVPVVAGVVTSNGASEDQVLFFGELLSNLQLGVTDVLLLFLVLYSFASMSRVLVLWVGIRLSYFTGHLIALKIFSGEMLKRYEDRLGVDTSHVTATISTRIDNFVGALFQLTIMLQAILIIVMIASLIIYKDPISAIIMTGIVLTPYFAASFLIKKKLVKNSNEVFHKQTGIIKTIKNSMDSYVELFVYQRIPVARDLFGNISKLLRLAQAENSFLGQFPRVLIEWLGVFFFVSIFLISDLNDSKFNSVIPSLALLIFSAQRLLPSVNQIQSAWSYLAGSSVTISEVASQVSEIPDEFLEKEIKASSIAINKIEFRNICFSFSNGLSVLENFSFTADKGDVVAVTGRSGSGKSTLISLLLGLHAPSGGEILINGKTRIAGDDFQRSFSYVPQSTFFVNGSVADNLCLFRQERVDDEIWHALELVSLARHVRGLPDGLDETLGENAQRLSGGQRQRLAIARAIYVGGRVLILDEATSGLDYETEVEIIKNIIESKSYDIIFFVTHNRSLLKDIKGIRKIAL